MIVRVVALRSEARPLIEAEKLHGESTRTPWPLYLSRDGGRALAISGVGRVAMAAAAAWVHGYLRSPASAAWLNLGIAGHSGAEVGSCFIAHRVVDRSTGRSWYPAGVPGLDLASDTVFTVDRPEREFPEVGAWDMEAAGFLAAASRWSLVETVQVVKVISDTPEDSLDTLDADRVGELMSARLGEFERVAVALEELSGQLDSRGVGDAVVDAVTGGRHFTVTQRRQLTRLLERYRALTGHEVEPADLADGGAGRTLEVLRERVETLAVAD